MTLQEKDKEYIWHPFTQAKLADDNIHIAKAKGCTLYAGDGREFIDAISSWWVNIHGHAHPHIAARIAQQAGELEHVIFAGFTHTPAITLAEKLLKLLPPDFSKIFYSDNGSTSVEVALKMSLQYFYNSGIKKKTKIIAFEDAYHGDTFGAMSVGGRSIFNAPFNDLLFEVEFIPIPTANNLDALIKKMEELLEQENIAAFIYEPLVQGTAGMKMYEASHLDILLSLVKKHEVLCIADEVMTGFGRTGKIFASEYLEQQPDIICLSKGITGGFMPLGVTACSQKVFDAFYSEDKTKTFFHGHSYTANPIACAAANASIELLNEPSCRKQIELISSLHSGFKEKMKSNSFIKDIRHLGTILAIELNTKEDTSYLNSIRDSAYNFCLNKGLLIRPLGNIIYLMPPFCITEQELKTTYDILEETIEYLKTY
jgi:adenosylmethionine-8-amino-7-oxononanoate aminotransferase